MAKILKILGETIIFDEERHRFQKENGEVIPSVTGITSILDKSDVLINWAVRLTENYLLSKIEAGEQITVLDIREATKKHRLEKEKAATIGDKIHEWVDQWIAKKNPELPEDEKVRNGITAFLEFQKQNKVKWTENSRIVYSAKYNFAGILDAIGQIKNELVLVDFKSSNGIYPEYALQTSGYQIAYEEETKKKIKYRLIIRFGKDTGSFDWRRYDENEKDKKAFLAALTLQKRLREL